MTPMLSDPISRRRLISGAGALALGALTLANAGCDPAIMRRLRQTAEREFPRHGVFVWQFSIDGSVEDIAQTLGARGLAAIVKTHDGVEWMSKYDPAAGAISGPDQVSAVAEIFEANGVPFHAWAVVKGIDPLREAQMAAAVLDAGARSITLDVEDHEGFWTGTPDDASRFGDELRARNEFGRVDISIDPRPWKLGKVPIREFVSFTDGIRPQLYWDAYNDSDHVNAYTYMGFLPGPDGITPDFLLDATYALLAPLDRWIVPLAPAAPSDPAALPRFARSSWQLGMPEIAVWRYALASTETLDYLSENPPSAAPIAA